MNLYALTLFFLVGLLLFIFYLRETLRQKVTQRSWLDRIEAIARENHTLWSLHLPYYHHQRISDELLELEAQSESILMSNEGGWHSPSDILKYPSVKKLFRRLLPHIESYAEMMGLDKKYLTITAWANVNRRNHLNKEHTHDDALFSGCYYLKAKASHENLSGGISFFKKQDSKNVLATFYPEPGDFLLFPSDMSHSVSPFLEDGQRISIAFNVHFGNRKKSWFLSQMPRSEVLQKIDPFHDLSGEKNAPSYVGNSDRKAMLFHTSKIKKFFLKLSK